jgi:hypothetical protein
VPGASSDNNDDFDRFFKARGNVWVRVEGQMFTYLQALIEVRMQFATIQ